MTNEVDKERHRRQMRKHKAAVDSRIANATEDRGVVVVLTGAGKGKSSSAYGMVARALGHGMRCGVVAFIKGTYPTGEEAFFRNIDGVEMVVMGEGFTWETQDRERDVEAAKSAWKRAAAMLLRPDLDLVVLDEVNVALRQGQIDVDDVVRSLALRPSNQHVVATGRHAPKKLIDAADTVSEVQMVKHAFKSGVRAQKGIEL